jgi:lactoylglutathione lyase
MQLYAVRIFVRNWPQSCDFYRDILGLSERFKSDAAGWAEYDVGGPCFGIERVAPEDREGGELVGRMVGVSLRVDDIDATYQSLKEKGVKFVSPPEKQPWGGSLAHFRDPDGNVLTLLG